MGSDLERILLPRLQRHFASREGRRRLRIVALWGDSFEWFIQWECVFALTPLMSKMRGDPWDYEQWRREKRHPALGQADMYFGGKTPLWVEMKAAPSCWGLGGKFAQGYNSLAHDIMNVRRVADDAAVCLLFAIEHDGVCTPADIQGIPEPDVVLPAWVDIGKVWCENCGKRLTTSLALYGWTNRPALEP